MTTVILMTIEASGATAPLWADDVRHQPSLLLSPDRVFANIPTNTSCQVIAWPWLVALQSLRLGTQCSWQPHAALVTGLSVAPELSWSRGSLAEALNGRAWTYLAATSNLTLISGVEYTLFNNPREIDGDFSTGLNSKRLLPWVYRYESSVDFAATFENQNRSRGVRIDFQQTIPEALAAGGHREWSALAFKQYSIRTARAWESGSVGVGLSYLIARLHGIRLGLFIPTLHFMLQIDNRP